MGGYPERITLFDDGVFRWHYDMDMWSNRYLLGLLMKVLGIICAAIAVMLVVMLGPASLTPGILFVLLLAIAGIFALALLIYWICAKVMHGVYRLYFAMDDSAVALVRPDHTQKMLDALPAIATLAGIAAGRPGEALRTGVALSAAGAAGTTFFSAVRRVRCHPECDVIDLREWFGMNQIYVNPEDYPFLRDFILEHVQDRARP